MNAVQREAVAVVKDRLAKFVEMSSSAQARKLFARFCKNDGSVFALIPHLRNKTHTKASLCEYYALYTMQQIELVKEVSQAACDYFDLYFTLWEKQVQAMS